MYCLKISWAKNLLFCHQFCWVLYILYFDFFCSVAKFIDRLARGSSAARDTVKTKFDISCALQEIKQRYTSAFKMHIDASRAPHCRFRGGNERLPFNGARDSHHISGSPLCDDLLCCVISRIILGEKKKESMDQGYNSKVQTLTIAPGCVVVLEDEESCKCVIFNSVVLLKVTVFYCSVFLAIISFPLVWNTSTRKYKHTVPQHLNLWLFSCHYTKLIDSWQFQQIFFLPPTETYSQNPCTVGFSILP